jgi:hypothetical protein
MPKCWGGGETCRPDSFQDSLDLLKGVVLAPNGYFSCSIRNAVNTTHAEVQIALPVNVRDFMRQDGGSG